MDCIFCKIAAGQIETEFVYQDLAVVAFRDSSPQAPVHILIIPRQHFDRVTAVDDANAKIFMDIHRAAQKIAEKLGLDGGFRLVTNNGKDAGQTVQHLHYHLMAGRQMANVFG